jgi:hypothetical protein
LGENFTAVFLIPNAEPRGQLMETVSPNNTQSNPPETCKKNQECLVNRSTLLKKKQTKKKTEIHYTYMVNLSSFPFLKNLYNKKNKNG